MDVNAGNAARGRSRAAFARDRLTFKRDGRHYAKVCCVCDQFIVYGEECYIDIHFFKNKNVQKVLGKNLIDLTDVSGDYGLSDDAAERVKTHYKIPDGMVPMSKRAYLDRLYLSPRSFLKPVPNGGRASKKLELGCCSKCKFALHRIKNSKKDDAPPPFQAIANGQMYGPVPAELLCLNEVEVSLISLARIDQHIMQFQGGPYQAVRGFHSMFKSDINAVSNAANWISENMSDEHKGPSTLDNLSDDDSTGQSNEESDAPRPKLARVAVILVGPFTRVQIDLVKKKTEVNWGRVKKALAWLKSNNRLYRAEDIDLQSIEPPIVVDRSEEVAGGSNNIERVFEMEAVFADGSIVSSENGACESREELKDIALQKMLSSCDNKEASLISRPTKNILKDYQGGNLLKAFPLQFPYGIGHLKADGEYRLGAHFYKSLSLKSSLHFQKASFVCVLYNMCERQKMISKAYCKQHRDDSCTYTDISNESMALAVDRFLDGRNGNLTSDKFVSRMRAVTGSMAHTAEQAKRERSSLFALTTYFGLPALMFTICPVDLFNFRILVFANTDGGYEGIPEVSPETDAVQNFVVDMRKILGDYPGLAALDFENVLRIVIRHIIGYNMEEQTNIKDEGIFGDVQACCACVEEQGRKKLHAHILIWLEHWSALYAGIGATSEVTKKKFETKLKRFAQSIMTTKIFDDHECNFGNLCSDNCPRQSNALSMFDLCTKQDLRELRTRKGVSSLGGKAIMRCRSCKQEYTSEDIAVSRLVSVFGKDAIYEDGNRPSFKNGFWEKNHRMSKAFLHMHMHILRSSIPVSPPRAKDDELFVSDLTRCFVAVTENLHKTDHANACFKKDCECRMKIPTSKRPECIIVYNDKLTNWYTWTGENKKKSLFLNCAKRAHTDAFANLFNQDVANIFQCNNNMVACLDGGSPMYCTKYTAKNTEKEDNRQIGEAAKSMIKVMNQHLLAKEEEKKTAIKNGTWKDDEPAVDATAVGLRFMIRAVFKACESHNVGAPMASFLTRNGTRFLHSHEFVYVNFNDFLKPLTSDFEISADSDGVVFLKSYVMTYLSRPKQLENLCLYEFYMRYHMGKRFKECMEWHGEHPSKDSYCVKPLPKEKWKIPKVTYRDFVDTKDFKEMNLMTCEIPVLVDSVRDAMEKYCQKACICFIPFRKICELKIDGSFHAKFRSHVLDGRLDEKWKKILQNMQDCRNSLNAGRPKEILERETAKPKRGSKEIDDYRDWEDDETEPSSADEAFADLIDNSQQIDSFAGPCFRTSDNTFKFDSAIVRCHGKHRCGSKVLITPNVCWPENGDLSVTAPLTSVQSNVPLELTYCDGDKSATNGVLLALMGTRTEMVIDLRWKRDVPKATGTLRNIREYANAVFEDDEEQKKAFECLAARFCYKIFTEHVLGNDDVEEQRPTKRRKIAQETKLLASVNHPGPFVVFLSGFGGSGKSHVLKAHIRYCSSFCKNAGVLFDRRTIVVTAMTGTAAVAINGETAHSAMAWKRSVGHTDVDAYRNTKQVIIDEISFAKMNDLVINEAKLRAIMENEDEPYGGMDVVYAGDMSQLKPPGGKAIYTEDVFPLWDDVHTFLELKTSHRFKDDKPWGDLLARFRQTGPTDNDINKINARVIGSPTGPSEDSIPQNACYATYSNLDRAAINDGIFAKHLESTHFKDFMHEPPKHTICIRASNCQWQIGKRSHRPMDPRSNDTFIAACGEGHVRSWDNSRHWDPLLKLFYKRPVMINGNIDVSNCCANGTMCEFEGVVFNEGVGYENLQRIVIDDYYVWCASVSQIKEVKLRLLDGLQDETEMKFHYLKPTNVSGMVNFPNPLYSTIDKNVDRRWRGFKMTTFSLNTANARTVHKLQGRGIENLVVSTWNYDEHWVYVALSRVKTITGLFLRLPLNKEKCKGMDEKLVTWMKALRKKTPPQIED